jgi:hypothetical protein
LKPRFFKIQTNLETFSKIKNWGFETKGFRSNDLNSKMILNSKENFEIPSKV